MAERMTVPTASEPSSAYLARGTVVVGSSPVLYHGSGAKGLTGLRPSSTGFWGRGIYLAEDRKFAEGYAVGVVFRLHLLMRGWWERVEGELYSCTVKSGTRLLNLDTYAYGEWQIFKQVVKDTLTTLMENPDTPKKTAKAAKRILKRWGKTRDGIDGLSFGITWANTSLRNATELMGFDGLIKTNDGDGKLVWIIFNPKNIENLKPVPKQIAARKEG
jgi:hypothetical protein